MITETGQNENQLVHETFPLNGSGASQGDNLLTPWRYMRQFTSSSKNHSVRRPGIVEQSLIASLTKDILCRYAATCSS